MNKHKLFAYLGACALIITSFLCWTYALRWSLGFVHAELIQQSIETVSVAHPIDVTVVKPIQEKRVDHAAAPIVAQLKTESIVEVAVVPKESDELVEWEITRAWSISIPSLGIRAPVLLPSMKFWSARSWEMLEKQMQMGLSYGTVAYPHSASPGQNGSLIIAGHSSPPDERAKESDFGSVFARVPGIIVGEDIIVSRGGKQIHYKVESTEIVSPDTTSILAQNADQTGILKLITCYPVGTTRSRFVVTARLMEDIAGEY